MSRRTIVFLDSGDTLVNEATEQRNGEGIVIRAEMIDGAKEAVSELYEAGYTLALVADGRKISFENMFRQHNLAHCFAAWSISETVGAEKPARAMFQTAMDLLGLTSGDKPRIAMVGNNLRKDIAGANRFGIRSVLLRWSPRYDMTPHASDESPDYVIDMPGELPALIARLEAEVQSLPTLFTQR